MGLKKYVEHQDLGHWQDACGVMGWAANEYATTPILLGDRISISTMMSANQNLGVENLAAADCFVRFSYIYPGGNVLLDLWPEHARDRGVQDSSSLCTFTVTFDSLGNK